MRPGCKISSELLSQCLLVATSMLWENAAMKARYTVVWGITGIQLGPDDGHVELINDPERGLRAVLTLDPDRYTLHGDRAAALGAMMLDFFFRGVPRPQDVEDGIAAWVEQIRAERRERTGSTPTLVVIVEREVQLEFSSPDRCQETESFILCLNAVDKDAIREELRPAITAAVNAIILGIDNLEAMRKVHDSVVFERHDGKPVYALTSHAVGSISVLKPLPEDAGRVISSLYTLLATADQLQRVQHLLRAAQETREDRLRAFLAAWSALEILINKLFPEYERRFFEHMLGEEPQVARRAFLERIRDVMKDKYGRSDKFAAIAFQLAPDDADEDFEAMKEIMRIRDRLLHGEQVDEDMLRVDQTLSLVRKYLRLHVEASTVRSIQQAS